MRYAVFILLLVLPATAIADEREVFYGKWGTERQCARAPIKPGGTVLAEPIEIRPGWLKHGQQWCRIKWLPVQARKNGLFTGARAQCGEDAVRDYLVRMELSGDDLTLRWGFWLSNRKLRRCPVS